MKSKGDCDNSISDIEVTDGRTFCIDGENFVLASTPDPKKNCRYFGDIYSCLEEFKDLPGANELDGDAWSGITVGDIVRGSVATWKMHS